MKLTAAAQFFDRQVCFDPFATGQTFRAQLDVFDDSKRDGATPVRRVLSMAPNVTLPASGCAQVGTDVYVLGARHEDLFNGNPIRWKYIMHLADGVAEIKTLAASATGAAGITTYAGRVWVKDLKEPEQSSGLFPYFNLFMPSTTTVALSSIIVLAGTRYFVRTSYASPAGFRAVECSELAATATAQVVYTDKSGSGYSVVNDAPTALAPVTAIGTILRFEDAFVRNAMGAAKNQPGDVTLAIAKALVTAAGAGDTWSSGGLSYRVHTVNADAANTSWLLHSRRA